MDQVRVRLQELTQDALVNCCKIMFQNSNSWVHAHPRQKQLQLFFTEFVIADIECDWIGYQLKNQWEYILVDLFPLEA